MARLPTAPLRSRYLYAVCQAGAERFLKEELARERPELRFSFSRPGFVTFKHADDGFAGFTTDFSPRAVFARAAGIQLGKARLGDLPEGAARDWRVEAGAVAAILALADRLREEGGGAKPRLQVWDRRPHVPGEEPPHYDPRAWSAGLEAFLRGNFPAVFAAPGASLEGELALTAVAVESDELWLGAYRHGPGHSPFAGGDPGLGLPAEAPSRAWLKVEEALRWAGVQTRAGERAIEIGSAPGGAAYALLQRGVSVLGIDPGAMDPVVTRFAGPARYRHLTAAVEEVPADELAREPIDWLLLDMNMPPVRALAAARRVAELQRESLRGVFLTVKLNQPEFAAEIPAYLDEVKSWGMSRVRAAQLASHKREILIHGLPRRASTAPRR